MQEGKLLRFADQPVWHDPQTDYLRRHVSPRSDMPIDLVQIELPAGSDIPMPASAYALARLINLADARRAGFCRGRYAPRDESG